MINEIITDSPSATTTPTKDISDIIVEITGPGTVYLEVKNPSGNWVIVTSMTGAFSITTPDDTLEYRFRPVGVDNQAAVYMGP